jgi:hypothetical protein
MPRDTKQFVADAIWEELKAMMKRSAALVAETVYEYTQYEDAGH